MNNIGRSAGALVCALMLLSCSESQTVEIPRPEAPERIVSLVPAVTEMLFALGAGERVVGVSDYDTYPPEVLRLPKVGALINPNLEKIFELQPEMVITYGTQSNLRERLDAAGIRSYSFLHGPIDDMLDYVLELSRELRMENEGRRLVDEIRGELDAIRGGASGYRPRVLLAHSREVGTMGSFYSGGGESFFNELIDIAGGVNIFGDVEDDSIQPSLEEVLKRRPEIIIELLPSNRDDPDQIAQRIQDWRQLETLPAVQRERVHVIAGDYLLLIGPRLHLAARRLAEVIREEE